MTTGMVLNKVLFRKFVLSIVKSLSAGAKEGKVTTLAHCTRLCSRPPPSVIPAKAGIQPPHLAAHWIPGQARNDEADSLSEDGNFHILSHTLKLERHRTMLDRQTLDDIIRRVVETAQPEKIILFGSAARGEMGPNSDVDLLIIKEGADALNLMSRIYRRLHGVGAAVDAIVVSPEDVERFKDSHALIIKPALREGRVVYEAA